MIRFKQVSSSVNYWLAVVGYDSHDRSVLTRLYLFYVFAFFSVWTLAVMFLASDVMANTLSPLLASQGIAYSDIVLTLGTLLLVLWSLYSIYRAANRSPLVFSAEDAHLLCQTPADRRLVTLAWFFGEWPSSVILFLVGAVTVGFTFLELDINNGIRILSLGHLAVAAIKPLGILTPLHLGLFAGVWIVGVSRLKRDAERIKVMRLLRLLALLLAATLFVAAIGSILLPSLFTVFRPLLSSLSFLLDAAFLKGDWGLGFGVTLGLMTISLAVLWHISDSLNLSRAAQETRSIQAQRVAFRIGNLDRNRELKDRERLGSMHVPSKIPTFPGAWMVTWKDVLQSLRTLTISRLWSWFVIFFLTVSGVVVGVILKDSASLFVLIVYWTLLVGQQTSARFKKDLGNWWLVKSLPLPARRIILHDVVRPGFAAIAITWLALWMSSLLGLSISPIVVCSIPFAVAGIAFSSVFDMLRQADISMLMMERPPDFGLVGLVFGMFCVAVPAVIYFMVERSSLSPLAGTLAIVLTGVSLAISLLHLCGRQFRRAG